MICPVCKKNNFDYTEYYLESYQTLFFCSAECQEKARKVLQYNSAKLSLRKLRQILKKLTPEPIEIKNPEPQKTELKKAKEETSKPKIKINSFSYRLFMERILADYSIKSLAEKSGISEEIIKHLENGDYKPTDFVADKLCKVLNKKLGRK